MMVIKNSLAINWHLNVFHSSMTAALKCILSAIELSPGSLGDQGEWILSTQTISPPPTPNPPPLPPPPLPSPLSLHTSTPTSATRMLKMAMMRWEEGAFSGPWAGVRPSATSHRGPSPLPQLAKIYWRGRVFSDTAIPPAMGLTLSLSTADTGARIIFFNI